MTAILPDEPRSGDILNVIPTDLKMVVSDRYNF
jgi:hypothetical protein